MTMPSPSRDDIHDALWRKGIVSWKLRPVQQRIKTAISDSKSLKYVVNCARRLGKSYTLCAMAIEDALQMEEAQIRFAAPTQKALKKILIPLMRIITKDVPSDLRPEYNGMDSVFTFPNTGSEIHMAGASAGHAESLRGTSADRCYVDEAGFIPDLKYLVEDILMPQLLTTRGKNHVNGAQLILSSTPPRTPAHEFAEYAHKAEVEGNYSKFTIYDAGYDEELIKVFLEEAGGPGTTTWKREYLCEFVVDEDYALVPEWVDSFVQPAPADRLFKHYGKFVAMDIGVADYTAVIFGYYDFRNSIMFVQDEIVMHGPKMTTDKLAAAIKKKERDLWGDMNVELRIADNNALLLLQDLGSMHDLHFAPTSKDMLESMINQVRIWVNAGRIRVDPKCAHLIGCLKYGVWDDARRQFARSSVYGHYDGLAALMYGVRNIDVVTNPIPPLLDIDQATHYIPDQVPEGPDVDLVKGMTGKGRFFNATN